MKKTETIFSETYIKGLDRGTTLYKYRSLADLKRFIDILINKRLYAAKYLELNDPMEGRFKFDSQLSQIERNKISDLRATKRICSLSCESNNGVMWSLYADSHKGCVIKLKVTSKSGNLFLINYTQIKPFITNVIDLEETVNGILTTKSQYWEYEKEARWISSNPNSSYVKIKIEEIIFGIKVSKSDYSFYSKLITSIDKRIKIRKETLTHNTIDFGYI